MENSFVTQPENAGELEVSTRLSRIRRMNLKQQGAFSRSLVFSPLFRTLGHTSPELACAWCPLDVYYEALM
jgi:hypothetical protein